MQSTSTMAEQKSTKTMEQEVEDHLHYIKWFLQCEKESNLPVLDSNPWIESEKKIKRIKKKETPDESLVEAFDYLQKKYEYVVECIEEYRNKLVSSSNLSEKRLVTERTIKLCDRFDKYMVACYVFFHLFLRENPGYSFPFDIP